MIKIGLRMFWIILDYLVGPNIIPGTSLRGSQKVTDGEKVMV